MLKKLRALLDHTPPAERRPLLKPAELRALKMLTREDGWPVLLKLLDNRAQTLGEMLLLAPDTERILHIRGQVQGIREAATLVDKTLTAGEDFDAYRQRSGADGADRARRERLATYGTSLWPGR